MLKIYIPRNNHIEKEYIVKYFSKQIDFDEIISFEFTNESDKYCLSYKERKIFISDVFLHEKNYNLEKKTFLTPEFKEIEDQSSALNPVFFFGNSQIEISENEMVFHFDIFGSIFWLLTRHEEYFCKEKDTHGRFLSTFSIMPLEYYDRPLVDELTLYLIEKINAFFDLRLSLKDQEKIILTHDIDHPFIVKNQSFKTIIKSMLGDLLKRKSFSLFFYRGLAYFTKKMKYDPANIIKWILKNNNSIQSESIFFFIAISRMGTLDTLCDIDDDMEKMQIKEILVSGANVALHPSYLTSENDEYFIEEKEKLNSILNPFHKDNLINSRQHYLRFDIKEHWNTFSKLGIQNEFSLGFSDRYGFRAGTSRPFKPFDVLRQKTYDFSVHSLLIMDTTLFVHRKETFEFIVDLHKKYRDIVKVFKGEFIVLWHNTELMTRKRKKLYNEIIKSIDNL